MESIIQTLVFISILNFTGLICLVFLALWCRKILKEATEYPEQWEDDELLIKAMRQRFIDDRKLNGQED